MMSRNKEVAAPSEPPVDGTILLDDLVDLIETYLSLPAYAAVKIALWILHTHAFTAAEHAPRLVFASPEPDCGKSTALKLLAHAVAKPMVTSNASTASIFRTIAKEKPTLILDEVDTFLTLKEELVNILNSGHEPYNAYVMRCRAKDFAPEKFSTYCPIAIALIGQLPSTALESRAIIIRMQRKLPEETIQRLNPDALQELKKWNSNAKIWAKNNVKDLTGAEPTFPEGMGTRLIDNWRPLLAIADMVDGHWPDTARKAAAASIGPLEPSTGVELLLAIREIFSNKLTISSTELCAKLENQNDDWKFKPKSLAKELKPYGISPKVVRIISKTPRGYSAEQFEDAFKRYLPPIPEEADTPV